MAFLLHIISQAEWDQVGTHYHPVSLNTEGFIHCSTLETVLIPANERFQGQKSLHLLVIDPHSVSAPIVFEDCEERGIEFPHIYGPLERTAVRSVLPFPTNEAGQFVLPKALVTKIHA